MINWIMSCGCQPSPPHVVGAVLAGASQLLLPPDFRNPCTFEADAVIYPNSSQEKSWFKLLFSAGFDSSLTDLLVTVEMQLERRKFTCSPVIYNYFIPVVLLLLPCQAGNLVSVACLRWNKNNNAVFVPLDRQASSASTSFDSEHPLGAAALGTDTDAYENNTGSCFPLAPPRPTPLPRGVPGRGRDDAGHRGAPGGRGWAASRK